MESFEKRKYLPVLWIVNMVVAAAFALFYLHFTSDIILEGAGSQGRQLLTHEGGLKQAAYRYGGMSVAVLVLQGLLYILNSGVLPFLEPDGDKVAPACLKMALGSTLLIMTITLAALVGGWPRP